MQAGNVTDELFGGQAPATAALLGWRYEDHDLERRWLRVSFEGRKEFLNPMGNVQGGILAAMLDDTMGPAAMMAMEGKALVPTINLNVSFLGAARPGRLFAEATVTQVGRSVCFVEGRLMDDDGRLVATATCSARVYPWEWMKD